MRELKHQNILWLREAFFEKRDARRVYLVTHPWAEQSLHDFFWDLLKQDKHESWYQPGALGSWPSVVRECLDGLEYLHARKIKHKDLKPRNILIYSADTGHGSLGVRPIIADFNISEDDYDPQGRTKGLGTPEFKAPEQIEHGEKTLLSDIWSLGCCFSLILLLLCAGKDRMHEIWRAIFEIPEEVGFYKDSNRKLVMDALQASGTHSDTPSIVIFVQEMKTLLERMLRVNYKDRPSARDACNILKELEYRLKIVQLDLPNINLCFESGRKVRVESIPKLELEPMGALINRCVSTAELNRLALQFKSLQSWTIENYRSRPSGVRVVFFSRPTTSERTMSAWSKSLEWLEWFVAGSSLSDPDVYLRADLDYKLSSTISGPWSFMPDWERSIGAFQTLEQTKQILSREYPDKIPEVGFFILEE